ncbi:MAG: DUF5110 domain-containing protein [Prevotellaceae bacterium]|jgi:alpha-glucosidase|nr:DUF5110 domain-containing protein [Prevotellaceae bacterium]
MNETVKEAGKILHYNCDDTGVFLKCENADVKISFYSSAAVRVDVSFARIFEKFSYAVETEPQTDIYRIEDCGSFLKLACENFVSIIDKQSFAVSFQTHDGLVINCDEQGLFNSQVENRTTAYKTLQKNERFIGLGEKCGGLDKRGRGFTNTNTDDFAYGTEADPLYATFPFYIGLHNGLCYGIFLDNTYQSDFNFGASNNRFSSFGVRGGNLNYYFIHCKNIVEIIKSYTELTGRMPLPPLWSLGYHQNRYSYYPDSTVLRIADTLRETKIPCDSITLDIHYMNEYRTFTWNRERFPDPEKLIRQLNGKGFKTTVIVDPGVKSKTLETEHIGDIFIKYPDGRDYEGEVWSGWSRFPDFTNPEARKWWEEKIKTLVNQGIAGIWNDMNEISTWGQKMPENLIFHWEGEKASELKARNIYGLQMARSSYEAFKNSGNRRPFILTRSAFSGIQRYSAVWTGDNSSNFQHLLMNIRMLMSMGITGVAFSGMDIGGFVGESSPGLFIRWIQTGTFIPYMRNHKIINAKSAEPWTFGEEALEISRNYISLRYRLLPYIYSLFVESAKTGIPIVRTLAIYYPFDDNVYNKLFENQFYFGNAIMIAPFDDIQKYGEIYFPDSIYYSLYNDDVIESRGFRTVALSLHTLPVYVKGSSIIPAHDLIMHTGEVPDEILSIHIYRGSCDNSFTYYEDDGKSFDYLNGEFYERKISYSPLQNIIAIDKVAGNRPSNFVRIKLILHGFDELRSVSIKNKKLEISDETVSFLAPVSAFNPQEKAVSADECKVKCVVFENICNRIEISLDM